jgi:hypothetical protein
VIMTNVILRERESIRREWSWGKEKNVILVFKKWFLICIFKKDFYENLI